MTSASPRSASSCTARSGPTPSAPMIDLGFDVFADIKLHDIPTTVGRVGAGVRRPRRALPELPRRRRRGDAAGRRRGPAGGRRRRRAAASRSPLAVTVLTSDADAPAERAARARRAGGRRAAAAASCARPSTSPSSGRSIPTLVCVTPGIRPPAPTRDDQGRAATPAAAIGAGADVLVVGRAVTAADDRAAAAAAVHDEVAAALARERAD